MPFDENWSVETERQEEGGRNLPITNVLVRRQQRFDVLNPSNGGRLLAGTLRRLRVHSTGTLAVTSAHRGALPLLPHLLGGFLIGYDGTYRRDDVLIAGTATEIAGELDANLLIRF